MQINSSNNNILYEVIYVRLFLIIALVFYHAFAVFSGAWAPIAGYPNIPVYSIIDKLSYACLLETFVFISGYILGYQVSKKGDEYIQTKQFMIKKIKRLIVPSILFSILYVLIFNKTNRSVLSTIYDILSGTGHMWFLPMLFWCFLFVYLLEKVRISNKLLVFIFPLMMFFSILPLPFRLNTAMYFFLFFWSGYCIQKYRLKKDYKTKTVFPIIAVCFIISFILKINLNELYINGGGNCLVANILNSVISIISRFICAVFGIALLMMAALKLANIKKHTKQTQLVNLSDCCFGVYIFQQFVLLLIERTDLAKNVSPYLYPWIIFLIALITSLVLTIIIRRTKVGSKIL